MAVVQVLQNSRGVSDKFWSQQKVLFQCDNIAVVQLLQSSNSVLGKSWSHQKLLFQHDIVGAVHLLQSSTGETRKYSKHQLDSVILELQLYCCIGTKFYYVWSKSWSHHKILFDWEQLKYQKILFQWNNMA